MISRVSPSFSHFLLLILWISAAHCTSTDDSDVSRVVPCGGTLEGDTGVLSYPGASGVVQPDELCIWTIHLSKTSTIRLNISQLDFNGGAGDSCTDGALRAYSLSNAVQGDNMESYTICPENQGSGVMFLSDNVMVVTFRTSISSTQGGAGFTLSWEGLKMSTTAHASTFSTSLDGIIRYPITGEYPPNTITTWQVSGVHPQGDYSGLDLKIESSDIETCAVAPDENCYCDAAIVYQVTAEGFLKEWTRFCGQLSAPLEIALEEMNFIVAFYSDTIDSPGTGNGFQLIWTPAKSSTTAVPSSTTPAPDVISTTCNDVLNLSEDDEGRISYTALQTAEGNVETCSWTVRADGSSNITFTLEEQSSVDGSFIEVHYFIPNQWGDVGTVIERDSLSSIGNAVRVPGPVAFVTFRSNGDLPVGSSSSFQLAVRRESSLDDAEYPIVSNYADNVYTDDAGSIRYPESGSYQDDELTTFVINPKQSNGSAYVLLNFDFVGLDDCFDGINIFQLTDAGFVLKRELCTADYITEYFSENVFLIVFTSGPSRVGEGFEARWKTVFPAPSQTCGGIIDLSRDLGAIDYTETESDRVREQCVWTVRGHLSRTITFTLTDSEFPECTSSSLFATGFTGNYSVGDSLRVEKKEIETCDKSQVNVPISMSGPVAFLVFARAPGSKFQLTIDYEPSPAEITFPYLSNYTDITRNEQSGKLSYPGPENWPQFEPYEWDTFVINPLGRNSTSRISLKFTQLDLGQADSCRSNNVMTYEIRDDGLMYQYMICYDSQIGTVEIFGDKTIVLVLRTSVVWSLYANMIRVEWSPRDE